MQRRVFVALVAMVASFYGAGCHWFQEKERAPLNGGETITYAMRLDTVKSVATLTFEREGRGFLIRAASPAYPPQRVASDLTSPLGEIAAYGLDMVWLPNGQRAIGTETKVGVVAKEMHYMGRDLIMVERQGTPATYGFDKSSGFLVYMMKPRDSAQLTNTTIPGM